MTTQKSNGTSVDDYLATLHHPHKQGVEVLRRAILEIDIRIKESVKWNAPSFSIDDHFATFRLHPGATFQLILHTGAKPKSQPKAFHLNDPQCLAKWAAKDRCIIAFTSDTDAQVKCAQVVSLTKQWLAQI